MTQRNLHRIFALSIGLFCCFLGNSVDGQEWARKMFTEFSHDFGPVARGTSPEHVFEIENCYEEDMVIEYVRSSCGCTKVELDKKVLKTWEKAKLTAKFDTVSFSGRRDATLTVGLARPYQAEVKLLVHGNILTDVQVYPSKIDFGTVTPSNLPRMSVTITRRNNSSFTISDVKSTFGHIGVALSEVQRNNASVTYQIQAWLKDDVPFGFAQGELSVIAKDGPNEIRIPVQFVGRVSPPLEISPRVLSLANLKSGSSVTRKVILKADQPFQLLDVTCDNKAFSVRADNTQKKPVHFVEITYTAPDDVANSEVELTFVTDLVTQPQAKLSAIVSVATEESNGSDK